MKTVSVCGSLKFLMGVFAVLIGGNAAVESAQSSVSEPAAPRSATAITIDSLTTVLIQRADIPARDAGVLKSIDVKIGDRVSAGQFLGSLDDERQVLAVQSAKLEHDIARIKADQKLDRQSAEAQVREAAQALARLRVSTVISEKLATSDVAIRLAEKSRDAAKFELDRAVKAKDAFSGSVSSAEINRLQTLFDQKSLEVEKSREDRSVAELKPDADRAAVGEQVEILERSRLLASQKDREQQVATTTMELAANELTSAEFNLDRRRLTAPFSGMIVALERQPGEWVESGTAVLRIIQLDRLRVEGHADARLATPALRGRAVTIQFHAEQLAAGNKTESVEGVITFVSPEIDPVNQQVRIHAEFANPDHRMRPGLTASMLVPINEAAAKIPDPVRR